MKRDQQKKKNDHHKEGDDKNTTATASTSDDGVSLVCTAGDCCHVDNSDSEWLVDTGASYHCVPHKEYFIDYRAGDFGSVKMGNQSSASIVGIGDIRVQTSVGCYMTLRDVRHIPDLRLNLLCANVLDQEGYKHTFGEGKWKLSKGSLTVARGKLCCTLYKTHLKVCTSELNAVEEKTSPNLWHRRLGHVSEKGIKLLAAVEIESGESSNQGEQNSPQVEEPTLRRSTRVRQPSRLYPSSEYILITDEGEPESLKEVLSHPDKDHWLKAMQEEMDSLKKNQTYDLVERPKGKKVLKSRYVFLTWFVYDLPRIGLEGEIVVGPAHFVWVPFFFGGGPNYVFPWLTNKRKEVKGLGSAGLTDRAERKKNRIERARRAGAEFSDQPHKSDHRRRSDRWIELKFSEVVPNT
ncbi:unnamed protein product [Cuscuta campestris]|uniref:Uncharacterized protein n=1 Tax=Cuscuta campestris TaxID=132261 RepID=A0A484M5U5_9ASTE|nr:unnamed protein product [Cuscuta campestris]